MAAKVAEKTIASLAILKVNSDRGQDYVGNFVPFVAECLRLSPKAEVSLAEIQSCIFDHFGLRIPQGALTTILKRASRNGYVSPTESNYQRNDDAIADLDFVRVQQDVLRQNEALLIKFIEFCKSEYHLDIDRDTAENDLLTFLGERATPILAAVVEGKPFEITKDLSKREEFIINKFITSLCKSDPQGFEYLETIIKGSMLANVLFFPELGQVNHRFEKTEIYLDTPFLLRALGFAGEVIQKPYQELLDILFELNANLCCFEETVEEIRGILDAAISALRNKHKLRQTNLDVLTYFIENNFSSSDVELIVTRLDRSLKTLRVEVKQRPIFTTELSIDEQKLQGVLEDEVKYGRREPLRHDLESLAAIYRLRKGQFPQRLEASKAIFVTTNSALVRASSRFFREEYGDRSLNVPHCILDHLLTTLVWLKKPTSAPELPRKMIIADCYAALNLPVSIWSRYLTEIDRLEQQGDISEEDYYFFRFSSEAKGILGDLTLGDPHAFSENTVQELMERSRSAARAPTEGKLATEQKGREEAERKASREASHTTALMLAQEEKVRGFSIKIAKIVAWLIIVSLIVVQLFAAFIINPDTLVGGFGWRLITRIILILIVFATILHLTLGITLVFLVRKFELKITGWLEMKLRRLFVPEID